MLAKLLHELNQLPLLLFCCDAGPASLSLFFAAQINKVGRTQKAHPKNYILAMKVRSI
jgi:hypothetical protein